MDQQHIEQILLSRSLPELIPAQHGWVLPHYDGLSIANLPATVAALLAGDAALEPGDELARLLPPLPRELWADWAPGIRRVVLIVIDALGYRTLQRMWDQTPTFRRLVDRGRMVPLTSVFPSTTDAALISVSTGRPPAEHGWLAYIMYLREVGVAADAIRLCHMWAHESDALLQWGLELDELLPVPSLASLLSGRGISTGAVYYSGFHNSGFSEMLYRGVAETRGHVHASDFWVGLRHLLAENRDRRFLLTGYWGGLDKLAHNYGPLAEQADAEYRSIDRLLGEEFLALLPPEDREGTLLLLTADHGQIEIPAELAVSARQHRGLSQHLTVPLVGESRAAFVFPRPGRAGDIRRFLSETFPGWFLTLDSEAALEAGLFGKPIYDEARARVGELLILPTGQHAIEHGSPRPTLVGRHGGLSQEEMLVPLVGVRLDAFD